MPTDGPSLSTRTSPGMLRIRRAPSMTTTISGPAQLPPPVPTASWRASSMATSSEIRRAVVAAVTPSVVMVSWPNAGCTWGSQLIHSQAFCPAVSVSR